jgi:hypothetical protein
MPISKPTFDWSSLNRSGLISLFMSVSDKIVGIELTPNQLHRILSNHIKKYLPIKVSKSNNSKVNFGYVYVGGAYYSDLDKEKQKCIEIAFNYNPFDEFITVSKRRLSQMSAVFADTILHEIIHMRQYRRRKFKDLPDYDSTAKKIEKRNMQSYLGCSDEIDAYGFNIACELYSRFKGNKKAIIKHLNVNQKHIRGKEDCWKMYLKAFDHDHNHKIIQRVQKKVVRYLPHAEIGKPYRNKEWISH